MPKFVTDILSDEKINVICKMSNQMLILHYNSLVDTIIEQGGNETEKQKALLYVIQGEALRREIKSIYQKTA